MYSECLNDDKELGREAMMMAVLLAFQILLVFSFTYWRVNLLSYEQVLSRIEDSEKIMQRSLI